MGAGICDGKSGLIEQIEFVMAALAQCHVPCTFDPSNRISRNVPQQ
jgi:hypothetical protein